MRKLFFMTLVLLASCLTVWSQQQPPMSGALSPTVNYELTDIDNGRHRLTISGTGDMPNYTSSYDLPWSDASVKNTIDEVVIAEGITSLGNYTLCQVHAPSISLPSSLIHIGDYAIDNNANLENITLPSSLKTVGKNAFSECPKLKSLTFPENVESVGNYVVNHDNALQFLEFKSAVPPVVGDNTFNIDIGYGKYASVFVPAEHVDAYLKLPDYKSHVIVTDGNCGVGGEGGSSIKFHFDMATGLLTITGTGDMKTFDYTPNGSDQRPWAGIKHNVKNIVINEGVTSVSTYAFAEFPQLISADFPRSIKNLGEFCFMGSPNMTLNLRSILPPEIVGNGVFSSLEDKKVNVCVPAVSLDAYKEVSFWSLQKMSVLTDENNITGGSCGANTDVVNWTITPDYELIIMGPGRNGHMLDFEDGAAPWSAYASDITKITMLNDIVNIGNYAFAGFSSVSSVVIPSSVLSFGNGAFANGKYKSIDMSALNSETFLYEFGIDVFRGCSSLSDINLPKMITEIPEGMFRECSSLEKITIPDRVTDIYDYAFYNASSLNGSISLPTNFYSIGNSAFEGCSSLDTLYVNSDNNNPIALGNASGLNTGSSTPLVVYLPDYSYTKLYANKTQWINAVNSGYIKFDAPLAVIKTGNCGNSDDMSNVTWELDNKGKLTIRGTGAMFDGRFPYNTDVNFGWNHPDFINLVTEVVVEDGVTTIGDYAFLDLANLSKFRFPENVTIGAGALSGTQWYADQPYGDIYIGSTYYSYKLRENEPMPVQVKFKPECTAVSPNAFWGITSLVLESRNATPPAISYYTFMNSFIVGEFNVIPDLKIRVPYKSVDTYKNAKEWSKFSDNIAAATFMKGKCGDYMNFELYDDGTMNFIGYSTMYDFEPGATPWNDFLDYIRTVMFTEFDYNSVSHIGANALNGAQYFEGFSSPIDNITSVGHDCFKGTKWLADQPDGQVLVNQTLYKYKNSAGSADDVTILFKDFIRGGDNAGFIGSVTDGAFDELKGALTLEVEWIPYLVNDHLFDGYNIENLNIILANKKIQKEFNEHPVWGKYKDKTTVRPPEGSLAGVLHYKVDGSVLSFSGTCEGLNFGPISPNRHRFHADIDVPSITKVVFSDEVTYLGTYFLEGYTHVSEIVFNGVTPPTLGANVFDNLGSALPQPSKVKLSIPFEAYKNKNYDGAEWSAFEKAVIGGYALEITVNDASMGTVNDLPSATNLIFVPAAHNQVRLEAKATPGNKFVKWEDGTTENPRTVTVTDNNTMCRAIFEERVAQVLQSGTCGLKDEEHPLGDQLKWELYDDGELVISGHGAMENYILIDNPAPWPEYEEPVAVNKVTICDGVTSIGSCAFYSRQFINDVTIPHTVKTIGKWAFGDIGYRFTDIYLQGDKAPVVDPLAFDAKFGPMTLHLLRIPQDIFEGNTTWADILANPKWIKEVTKDIPALNLTLETNNADYGKLTGSGFYVSGANVDIAAIANPGYKFTGWSDGEQASERTIVMTENIKLTANFINDSPATSVENADQTDANVYAANGQISIEAYAETPSDYIICNAAGLLIEHGRTTSGCVSVAYLPRGIYFVRIAEKTYKIIL